MIEKAFFDGKHFHNINGTQGRTIWEVIKWLTSREKIQWPTFNNAQKNLLFQRSDSLVITFIIHSTLLIQLDSCNILTDPIWSKRCSYFKNIGPKRVINPGIAFCDLPPIDVVLVSHNHYDHLDLTTLKALNEKFHPVFITPLENGKLLKKTGVPSRKIFEVDWGDAVTLEKLKITCVPAQHYSRRGFFDYNQMLWGGFVIEGSKTVYFAGDTGYFKDFHTIRDAFKAIDAACLPIGTYKPEWFMAPVHMNPFEAVKAHFDLNAGISIGMHYGSFPLSDETYFQPKIDLQKAKQERDLDEESFILLDPGEARVFDA